MSKAKKSFKSTAPGKYPCPKCDQVFTFIGNQRRHYRKKHTRETPVRYECQTCKKSFNSNSYLRVHVNVIHNGNKNGPNTEVIENVKCNICFKIFSSKYCLNDHLRYIHDAGSTPRELFTCDFCQRQFNRKDNLKFHIMYSPCNPFRVIRKSVLCPYCGIKNLETSLRTHTRKCKFKNETVSNAESSQRKHNNTKYNKTKSKRKSEIENIKSISSYTLEKSIPDEGVSIKMEDNDEYAIEVGAGTYSSTDDSGLRRSSRKRKRRDYQYLNAGVEPAKLDGDLTWSNNASAIETVFRVNDFTVKLHTTQNENKDIQNNLYWEYVQGDSETVAHAAKAQEDLSNRTPEVDILNLDGDKVFKSNVVLNYEVRTSVYEEFMKYTEDSLEENASPKDEKNKSSLQNDSQEKSVQSQNIKLECDVSEILNSENSKTDTTGFTISPWKKENEFAIEIIKEDLETVSNDAACANVKNKNQNNAEIDTEEISTSVGFYKLLGFE